MSSRSSLLSHQNRQSGGPSVHRSHGNRDSRFGHRQQPPEVRDLPPYEPPSCPLLASTKHSIPEIIMNIDLKKYEKHLNAAIKNITNFAGESNDRLYAIQERVSRMAIKREAADDDSEKTKAEEEAEHRALKMQKRVDKLTEESEKALRDLIDYKQELAEQGAMLQKISDEATTASSAISSATVSRQRPVSRERGRYRGSDDEESLPEPGTEDEDVAVNGAESQAAILSPTELLKKAKEDHQTQYRSKTLRARYAENNDYIGFKRIIHDAQHPGENVPPASTWFLDEAGGNTNPAAARRRRLATQTDNSENDEDEDDIQMTAVVSSLKCPLTLQTFKEPYSNHVCKHTFERSAILQFHLENAVAYVDPSQGGRRGRGVPTGPKQLKCPERGCDAMLELKDFYLDNLILRQVKRQQAQAAAEMEDDFGGDDVVVPATQPTKSRNAASSQTPRVKQEKTGRGRPRVISSSESEDGDPEPIEVDE